MLRTRHLLALVAVSFVLVAAACADATAPQPHALTCDVNNPNVCH
jgi:hypothetical protein